MPASHWLKSPLTWALLAASAALLLSVAAAAFGLRFVSEIPEVRAVMVAERGQTTSLAPSVDARAALLLAEASDAVGRAVEDPNQMPTAWNAVRSAAQQNASGTFLPRLHQVMLAAVQARRTTVSDEAVWRQLGPVLSGMDAQNLSHDLPDALVFARRYNAAQGHGLAGAAMLGDVQYAHRHQAFLQHAVGELRWLTALAPDAEARDSVRRVCSSLLKQWVLLDGPLGLRLLAADLLADELEADATAPTTVVEALRTWRAAVRGELATRPTETFGITRQPTLVVSEDRALVRSTAAQLAALGVNAAIALAANVALIIGWREKQSTATTTHLRLPGALLIVLVVLAPLFAAYAAADVAAADVRRLYATGDAPPVTAVAAAVGVLVATCATIWLVKPRRVAAALLCGVWVGSATVWLIATLVALNAMSDWQTAFAVAADQPLAAVLGAEGEAALEPLRRWRP